MLLHAYFSPIYVPTIPYGTDNFNFQIEREESVKSMIETVHNELNKLSDTIKKKVESGEFPNIKYTCILRDGIPEEEILRYAKEYNPQIIIMGTRGRSQKDIDLIGSVTAEVIERSKSFVYAIPEHTPLKTFNDIKKVAFVTNFDQRDLIAFDSLINAFKSFHFAVSFIHLSTDNDAWNEIKLAGIKDYFQKQYSKLELYYNVVKEDNILNNLDNYVKEENIEEHDMHSEHFYIKQEDVDKILKAFYLVYNTLGYGFLERVYQNALYFELIEQGFKCEVQKQINVFYKNHKVGEYYADMVINNSIILELKAADALRPEHEFQLINYLKATDIEIGYLLNFGKHPEFKRKIFSHH